MEQVELVDRLIKAGQVAVLVELYPLVLTQQVVMVEVMLAELAVVQQVVQQEILEQQALADKEAVEVEQALLGLLDLVVLEANQAAEGVVVVHHKTEITQAQEGLEVRALFASIHGR